MIISGAICIILSILDTYLINSDFLSKSYLVLILLSVTSPFYTDIHLRMLFDKNGNLKIKNKAIVKVSSTIYFCFEITSNPKLSKRVLEDAFKINLSNLP
ncbi:hypothetical protein HF875_03920 [Paraclostridium bifermentans]|uniref:Uncharacterized protein n=1 Tax=Paraclostridium bifermentans TaxID=1490 RepID=A0AA44DJG9_PARBF|nr:hypothetical protein [Paraclostridium bifermentans]NME08652.1 hypothetical protein [Paraclostridium bifermentans]